MNRNLKPMIAKAIVLIFYLIGVTTIIIVPIWLWFDSIDAHIVLKVWNFAGIVIIIGFIFIAILGYSLEDSW